MPGGTGTWGINTWEWWYPGVLTPGLRVHGGVGTWGFRFLAFWYPGMLVP